MIYNHQSQFVVFPQVYIPVLRNMMGTEECYRDAKNDPSIFQNMQLVTVTKSDEELEVDVETDQDHLGKLGQQPMEVDNVSVIKCLKEYEEEMSEQSLKQSNKNLFQVRPSSTPRDSLQSNSSLVQETPTMHHCNRRRTTIPDAVPTSVIAHEGHPTPPVEKAFRNPRETSSEVSHGRLDVFQTEVKHETKCDSEMINLRLIEIESQEMLTNDHYMPETDESLMNFTPKSELRVIEEHHQYRGNEPGQKDRQYNCQFCHKIFRRKEEKKRHENSHLNIRQHKCRICDKTFMRADHRNSHEKTHAKNKEYSCKICNKSFRRADEQKRHLQRQIHLRNVARAKKAEAN